MRQIEMVTESGKKVKVHRSADGYVTMVECQTALDNLDAYDVHELKTYLRPGTVFMRGAVWEFHSVWSVSECRRLGVQMPKGF